MAVVKYNRVFFMHRDDILRYEMLKALKTLRSLYEDRHCIVSENGPAQIPAKQVTTQFRAKTNLN